MVEQVVQADFDERVCLLCAWSEGALSVQGKGRSYLRILLRFRKSTSLDRWKIGSCDPDDPSLYLFDGHERANLR